ncbi:MAG: hypothetical protein ACTHYV_09070 [Psychroflexus sp.]
MTLKEAIIANDFSASIMSEIEEEKKSKTPKKSLRDHPLLIVRIFANIGFYLWIAVMAIGAFFAWLISLLFI